MPFQTQDGIMKRAVAFDKWELNYIILHHKLSYTDINIYIYIYNNKNIILLAFTIL